VAWTDFFFFFTLVTGPRRSLSLKLSDTSVYEPQIRARLGTTAGGVSAPHPDDLSRLARNVSGNRLGREEVSARNAQRIDNLLVRIHRRGPVAWTDGGGP